MYSPGHLDELRSRGDYNLLKACVPRVDEFLLSHRGVEDVESFLVSRGVTGMPLSPGYAEELSGVLSTPWMRESVMRIDAALVAHPWGTGEKQVKVGLGPASRGSFSRGQLTTLEELYAGYGWKVRVYIGKAREGLYAFQAWDNPQYVWAELESEE